MGLDELERTRAHLNANSEILFDNMKIIANESCRVAEVAHNAGDILEELDVRFQEETGLRDHDHAFLFLAIGLQIARQYLVTKFPERLDDQTAAKQTAGHQEEHSNRHHRYYNPSLEEVITNPVPFDANVGANGALSGGGKLGHRATAIGHDPVLGLIFGTANIATATLTNYAFDSYHIGTNAAKRDFFKSNARTDLVLQNTVNKLLHGGPEGKAIVGAALVKEIVHLKSDLNTKNSLPLPFVSAVSPKLASDLASYGLDMANVVAVGKQATISILINTLIAMIHRLYYDGPDDEKSRKLYEVRTRKIISYSNLVASSSNVTVVAITKNMKLFDIGGLAVTIGTLITNRKFIRQVKEEFVYGSFKSMICGEELKLKELIPWEE